MALVAERETQYFKIPLLYLVLFNMKLIFCLLSFSVADLI